MSHVKFGKKCSDISRNIVSKVGCARGLLSSYASKVEIIDTKLNIRFDKIFFFKFKFKRHEILNEINTTALTKTKENNKNKLA